MLDPSIAAVLLPLLAQDPGTTPEQNGYPNFGNVVGEAGDVDGDRVPDVVVGETDFEAESLRESALQIG